MLAVIAFTIYLGANIGLALQRNYAALLVLRMLQSGGSSGTIALVYAVVADIAPSSERGKYMGLVGSGITIGPAVGPVIGKPNLNTSFTLAVLAVHTSGLALTWLQ